MTASTQSLVLDTIVAGIEARNLTAAIDYRFSNSGTLIAYDDLDPVFTITFDFQDQGGKLARSKTQTRISELEAWTHGDGRTPRSAVDTVLGWLDEARPASDTTPAKVFQANLTAFIVGQVAKLPEWPGLNADGTCPTGGCKGTPTDFMAVAWASGTWQALGLNPAKPVFGTVFESGDFLGDAAGEAIECGRCNHLWKMPTTREYV